MSLALTLPLVALGREAVKKAVDAAQAMAAARATIASAGNSLGQDGRAARGNRQAAARNLDSMTTRISSRASP
jgi:hypothetical protein